mmetsp:Transcript_64911/g.120808  ORF Transcript_64911/g.120808 Transcript_64911/m.120808 type:complete len:211 (+) Transcript_64911:1260-1892(+)
MTSATASGAFACAAAVTVRREILELFAMSSAASGAFCRMAWIKPTYVLSSSSLTALSSFEASGKADSSGSGTGTVVSSSDLASTATSLFGAAAVAGGSCSEGVTSSAATSASSAATSSTASSAPGSWSAWSTWVSTTIGSASVAATSSAPSAPADPCSGLFATAIASASTTSAAAAGKPSASFNSPVPLSSSASACGSVCSSKGSIKALS